METRAKRDKQLAAQINLLSALPITAARNQTMLKCVLELCRLRGINDKKRQSLAKILDDSAIPPDYDIEFRGDRVYINGEFSSSELAKRMVW